MRPPCDRACPERTAFCKKTCPRWAEYESWYMENQKEKEIQYEHDADYYAVVSESVRKSQSVKR